MPTLLVLGARNLGGAILDRFGERGYALAAVARSSETARQVGARHPKALALTADVSDPAALRGVLDSVGRRWGTIDVAVNAVSPVRDGAVTSGTLAELPVDAMSPYTQQLIPAVFHFLREVGRVMAQHGSGTLIQVTGGSARRAMPGRGPWAAAAHATRALTHAAAQELRQGGVHAALLVVDAVIESDKTRDQLRGKPASYSASHDVVVDAVEFLARQTERGWTHELTLTPMGDRWVP